MASIPGGPSDKWGNDFERLWTVRHLLQILSGKASSINIEFLGDDERGAEFWVSRPAHGIREAHQCKRENRAQGTWSVADLAAKKVIANAQFQLNRDPCNRFVFASADKAPLLSDLAERAKQYGSNPDQFYKHAVPTSVDHTTEFATLCAGLKLDPNNPPELVQIIDFLNRFTPLLEEKASQRGDIELYSELLVNGDPKTVVAILEALVNESVGKTLREPDISQRLRERGLPPRDLTRDLTLTGKVSDLSERFRRSYCDLLIGGEPLQRSETTELMKLLTASDGPRLILLHGASGDGKSGVVFELATKLDEQKIPYLPLRLDRDKPADSPRQYGERLELPASPAACLVALADGRPAVLILDQIDALRWTSAHSAHAWDTCERIINECLRYPNLRVVAVCRTFDAEENEQIKNWKKRANATEMKVGILDDAKVNAIVDACGVDSRTLEERQRHILRSPQSLYLWRELNATGHVPVFRTQTDLMRAFWKMIRNKLTELTPGEYDEVIDSLVDDMDRQGAVSAPLTIVSKWPREVAALMSLNILIAGGTSRILFAHQSYVDHLTAEKVLREIHSGGTTISGWLRGDDQSLFRRNQLRQILVLMRDEDPQKYSEALYDLLTSSDIRFHLQHLALQTLGHADPPNVAEVDLVLDLMNDPKMIDHLEMQVLYGRATWFDALYARGTLAKWLDGGAERLINLAVNLTERMIEIRGVEAGKLFFRRHGEMWDKCRRGVLWRCDPGLLVDQWFDVYVDYVKSGFHTTGLVNWKKLALSERAFRAVLLLDARQQQAVKLFRSWLRGNENTSSRLPDSIDRD